jgi:hypothetical protein
MPLGRNVSRAGSGEFRVVFDLLGELVASDVRRLFLDETSSSSKGFGLVEHGSDDTARSLKSFDGEGWSIGLDDPQAIDG